MRAGPGKVAADGDRDRSLVLHVRVEQVDVPRLLEHQDAATGLEAAGVEVLEVGELLEFPRVRVVGPHVDRVVAIGEKVDRLVHVDGIVIVAAVPGQLLDRVVGEVEHPDRLVLATAVVAPLGLPALDRLVGELLAVGGELTPPGAGHGHRIREPAVEGDRPQLRVGDRRARSPGGEYHAAAVVGPAPGQVRAGVPGQSSRLASLDRNHVDVGVAVVLAGEGHEGPVRRELGSALDALKAGQAPRRSAVATDDPQVGGICEDDMLVADVRLTQKLGFGAERGAGASQGQPYGDEQANPHNAISS